MDTESQNLKDRLNRDIVIIGTVYSRYCGGMGNTLLDAMTHYGHEPAKKTYNIIVNQRLFNHISFHFINWTHYILAVGDYVHSVKVYLQSHKLKQAEQYELRLHELINMAPPLHKSQYRRRHSNLMMHHKSVAVMLKGTGLTIQGLDRLVTKGKNDE